MRLCGWTGRRKADKPRPRLWHELGRLGLASDVKILCMNSDQIFGHQTGNVQHESVYAGRTAMVWCTRTSNTTGSVSSSNANPYTTELCFRGLTGRSPRLSR
jgi:hypothetical protein